MICAIIVFFLPIAAANFDYPGRPTMDDLKQFYSQGQITYLVKRSYISKVNGNQDPTCIYNKVHNISDSVLNMYQSYTYETSDYTSVAFTYPVNVHISRSSGYDVAPLMKAYGDLYPPMTRYYSFHYHDSNAHCAVLTFKDYSGTLRCELHTWKTTASYKYYGNCQVEYDYQCPGRKSYSVYLKNCPNAV